MQSVLVWVVFASLFWAAGVVAATEEYPSGTIRSPFNTLDDSYGDAVIARNLTVDGNITVLGELNAPIITELMADIAGIQQNLSTTPTSLQLGLPSATISLATQVNTYAETTAPQVFQVPDFVANFGTPATSTSATLLTLSPDIDLQSPVTITVVSGSYHTRVGFNSMNTLCGWTSQLVVDGMALTANSGKFLTASTDQDDVFPLQTYTTMVRSSQVTVGYRFQPDNNPQCVETYMNVQVGLTATYSVRGIGLQVSHALNVSDVYTSALHLGAAGVSVPVSAGVAYPVFTTSQLTFTMPDVSAPAAQLVGSTSGTPLILPSNAYLGQPITVNLVSGSWHVQQDSSQVENYCGWSNTVTINGQNLNNGYGDGFNNDVTDEDHSFVPQSAPILVNSPQLSVGVNWQADSSCFEQFSNIQVTLTVTYAVQQAVVSVGGFVTNADQSQWNTGLTYLNDWQADQSVATWPVPAYYVDALGWVNLRGRVQGSVGCSFSVPASVAPVYDVYPLVNKGGVAAELHVQPNGQVCLTTAAGSSTYVTLDGLRWPIVG